MVMVSASLLVFITRLGVKYSTWTRYLYLSTKYWDLYLKLKKLYLYLDLYLDPEYLQVLCKYSQVLWSSPCSIGGADHCT